MFESDLHAAVAHCSDVAHCRVAVAHVSRSGDIHKHILCVAEEEVDRTCEFVFPQAEVHAGTPLLCVFPVSAIVHPSEHCGTVGELLAFAKHIVNKCRTIIEHLQCKRAVADVVVTYATPSCTDFEEVEIVEIFHEAFLADFPCQSG